MGMGSAYAAGAGIVKEQDSYVPLMRSYTDMAKVKMPTVPTVSGGMGRRPSYARRGVSSAVRETERQRQKLEEKKYEDEQRAMRDRKNQYMAAHHGREPTPEDLADVGYRREKEERDIDREESSRRFDETLAAREREMELRREETTREDKDVLGLKEREDARRQGRYRREMTEADMGIDKKRRTEDFDNMMKAFLTGDYNEVAAYFIRYGTPGDDKNLSYPIIEPTDDPSTVLVTWPGRGQPELMNKDALGELFVRMNPKFEERPKQKRAKKGTSRKDAAKAAANYAKGVSKDDPDLYEEAYREEYERIMSGDTQGQGGKTVVRRQRNRATGQVRITYSDGTTEIQ